MSSDRNTIRGFITDDKNAKAMVEHAEAMAKNLGENKVKASQLRNAFGTVKKLEMDGWQEEKTQSQLHLLKPRMAYAAARQFGGAQFAMKALAEDLSHAIDAVENAASFQRFCHYFEAILAYHKVHGGN